MSRINSEDTIVNTDKTHIDYKHWSIISQREVHNLSTQLAVTQQDLKDKNNTISNLQEQLNISNTQKSKLETQVENEKMVTLNLLIN